MKLQTCSNNNPYCFNKTSNFLLILFVYIFFLLKKDKITARYHVQMIWRLVQAILLYCTLSW
jgi:hypothetical protein